MSVNAEVMDLSGFDAYMHKLLPEMKRRYDRAINRDLSRQQYAGLFKRNIAAVLQQVYQETLDLLRQVDFANDGPRDGADLIKRMLRDFDSLIDELIQYALQKHRSSCALSNFPAEHNPSQAYIDELIGIVRQDWSAFVEQATVLIPA